MSVLMETSKGDLVIDLHVDDCPNTTKNFLKLCQMKYYNNCLFHSVQSNFIAQTGDPTGTGRGGSSVFGVMYGDQARFFDDELRPSLRHTTRGTVAMASGGENMNASQFYITLADGLDSLDEKHTVFGQVAEGFEVLDKLNEAFVDDAGRPYQNIRIRHIIVLDDPFADPPQLAEHVPEASPEPTFEKGDRLEDDWAPKEETRGVDEIEEATRRSEAENRAVVLEMIGDLPEADAKPPANMLFVAKLNGVTTEEDLEIIFARFGVVTSCDIIRDAKTGDSLCYGFIGFDTEPACEEAYFKMNNVLVDDRRIKVDFSQSVSHIWKQFKKFGRGGGDKGLGLDEGPDGGGRGGGSRGGGRGGSGGRGGGGGRIEMRDGGRHGPARGAGRGGSGGGMLFDHHHAAAGEHAPTGGPAEAGRPAGHSGGDRKRNRSPAPPAAPRPPSRPGHGDAAPPPRRPDGGGHDGRTDLAGARPQNGQRDGGRDNGRDSGRDADRHYRPHHEDSGRGRDSGPSRRDGAPLSQQGGHHSRQDDRRDERRDDKRGERDEGRAAAVRPSGGDGGAGGHRHDSERDDRKQGGRDRSRERADAPARLEERGRDGRHGGKGREAPADDAPRRGEEDRDRHGGRDREPRSADQSGSRQPAAARGDRRDRGDEDSRHRR